MFNFILERKVLNNAYEIMMSSPKGTEDWQNAAETVYKITERRNERSKNRLDFAGKVVGAVVPAATSIFMGSVCLGFEQNNVISSRVAQKCIDMGLKSK